MGRIEEFEKTCSSNEPEDLKDYSGESVIEWLRGDKEITVTFPVGTKGCNRILDYAEKYPEEVKITHKNPDGGIVARIPKRYLRISRPADRFVTDEQKEAAIKRLQIAREKAAKKKQQKAEAQS